MTHAGVRLRGWFACWDRPWNARTARLEALRGQVYCPCPKHRGLMLSEAGRTHLKHLVDVSRELSDG